MVSFDFEFTFRRKLFVLVSVVVVGVMFLFGGYFGVVGIFLGVVGGWFVYPLLNEYSVSSKKKNLEKKRLEVKKLESELSGK